MVAEDFNIIRFANKTNKDTGLSRFSCLFYSIIASQELIDLHMTGGRYTWSNNQSYPTLERLDRVLVSKGWENLFSRALVHKLPREVSDYNPLILTTKADQPLRQIMFKFELSWVKHPDFPNLV